MLLEDLDDRARRRTGLVEERRRRGQVVGAEHDVDVAGALDDQLAVLLREAAADRDLEVGTARLQRLEVPEVAVELVVGVLPDAAGVEHDDVGGLDIVGRLHALCGEQARDALGVVLVHLAPEGAHVEAAGHDGQVYERRGSQCAAPHDLRSERAGCTIGRRSSALVAAARRARRLDRAGIDRRRPQHRRGAVRRARRPRGAARRRSCSSRSRSRSRRSLREHHAVDRLALPVDARRRAPRHGRRARDRRGRRRQHAHGDRRGDDARGRAAERRSRRRFRSTRGTALGAGFIVERVRHRDRRRRAAGGAALPAPHRADRPGDARRRSSRASAALSIVGYTRHRRDRRRPGAVRARARAADGRRALDQPALPRPRRPRLAAPGGAHALGRRRHVAALVRGASPDACAPAEAKRVPAGAGHSRRHSGASLVLLGALLGEIATCRRVTSVARSGAVVGVGRRHRPSSVELGR